MDTFSVYSSATDLIAGMKGGYISSRDLVEQYAERIAQKNGKLNTVIAMGLDEARRQADAADILQARGESIGLLHGLPITLKDTWEMPGLPCTAGAPEYRRHRPAIAGPAVKRLLDAGAIVLGKTNVPYLASDIQTYNPVYGVSNNPWNLGHTPGGSSGGAAAALAAGFTALELGSDLAGSIRIPAHYCGVYGHKPTHGIVPVQGHIPGPPGTMSSPPLVVAGPMSRTAVDLRLMMDVLNSPVPGQVLLAPATLKHLREFKVLFWMDDPSCPIDKDMATQYRQLKTKLETAGVSVTEGAPLNTSLQELFQLYIRFLGALMGTSMPSVQRHFMGLAGIMLPPLATTLRAPPGFSDYLSGVNMSYAEFRHLEERKAQLKHAFCSAFNDYDVILMPPAATTAIPHQHTPPMPQRRIQINGQLRSYMDLFHWISIATLFDLPATSAPIGIAENGLPVNIQILGRPYHDLTTIQFAEQLEAVIGGFQAPPMYELSM